MSSYIIFTFFINLIEFIYNFNKLNSKVFPSFLLLTQVFCIILLNYFGQADSFNIYTVLYIIFYPIINYNLYNKE